MTHDFAKKTKASAKKSKKKPARKSQVPGWVWLFTGIVTGVFISFLGYLADIAPEPAPDDLFAVQSTPAKNGDQEAIKATRFDFYTLLPEREMIVPEQKQETTETLPEQAVIYILQAGSFKNAADADRLRAQLILMGFDTKIEAVSVARGDLWHRVQVGPFVSRSKLAKARSTLIQQGIDTLLLKRKADS